ncbi:MAG: GNAT family N-acetyltransferase [Tepidiformaceae bacterium]
MADVRRARQGDARFIAVAWFEGWQRAYRGLLPDAVLDRMSIDAGEARWAGYLEDLPPSVRLWVSEHERAVVGYGLTGPSRDISDDDREAVAEVYAIYLRPALWGTGIGRELFAHAIADLRSRGYLAATLWVVEANARARRFYERAGLSPDGARRMEKFDGAEAEEVRYRVVFDLENPTRGQG